MPKNVIEYAFEGNILNLEQAIKKIATLLNGSARTFRKYQDGKLNDEQKAQLESARALLKRLRAQKKLTREATDAEVRQTNLAGRQALRTATLLQREATRVQKRANAEAQRLRDEEAAKVAEHQRRVKEAVSVAGQEQALQRASFLGTYSDQLKNMLSSDAYGEIQRAVDEVRAATRAFAEHKITEEELAEAVDRVNQAYSDYSAALKNAKNAQQAAGRGVHDLKSMLVALEQQMLATVKSLYFWTNLLRQAFAVVREGITYYAAYVESLNFLERAAGDSASAMRKFTNEQIRAFGLDPTAINTAAAMFYSFADSMGFTAEQATTMSQTLTKLSQDIASLQNIDVETAAEKLRSALAGQSKALATLGINVNDANIEEWLATKGINESMKQMNELSQAAARYAFIIEKSAAAQGDLAKTLGSPANQIKILSTQTKLLVQNLGALGSTLLLPLLKGLNQILLPLNALLTAMTSGAADGFSSSVGEAGDAVAGLTEDLREANAEAKGLTGIDEINQFTASTTIEDKSSLNKDIMALIKSYDNLATQSSALVPIFEALGNVLAPIWDMFNNETNFSLLTGALEGLAQILYPIQLLFEGIAYLLNLIPTPFRNVVSLILEAVIGLTMLSALLSVVKTLMASKVFVTFAATFKAIAVAILSAIKTAITWIATSVKMVAHSIAVGIKNLWEAGTWWAKAAAIVAAAGVGALVVAAVAGAGVAAVKAAQASSTPQLATGGVTTGPTFAMIGEGRYDEAVVPLGNSPQFTEMKADIAGEVASKLGGPGGTRSRGQATPIILNLNGREVARAMFSDLGNVQPQMGVSLK